MANRTSHPRIVILPLLFLFALALMGWVGLSAAQTEPVKAIPAALLSAEQQTAQQIVLGTQRLSVGRSEIFQIAPQPYFPSIANNQCADGACYQVDIYDYDANATDVFIVDITADRIVESWRMDNSVPHFSAAVADRAKQILINSADLTAALGRQALSHEIDLMVGGYDDSCPERALCLTNVFVVDGGMIWTTVNMHQNALVGIWWTERAPSKVGWPDRNAPLESAGGSLCGSTFNHVADGWDVTYEVSISDGLHAYDVSYQGRRVIESLKLTEWHVDYVWQEDQRGPEADPAGPDGFIDFVTCLQTSGGGAIKAFGTPTVLPMVAMSQTVGFEIVQDFRQSWWHQFDCRYRYDQRYQFFNDGRFRVVAGGYGIGCGIPRDEEQAVYRPVMRIDLTADNGSETFDFWDGDGWSEQTTEAWFGDAEHTASWTPHPADANGYAFRVQSGNRGFYMEPGVGQFDDGGTGDDAWVYVTRFDSAEGAADLSFLVDTAVISNHEQGPDQFVDAPSEASAAISGQDNVIWYVPNMSTVTSAQAALPADERPADAAYCWADTHNDANPGTIYPCFAGPMFTPFTVPPTSVGVLNTDSAESPSAILTGLLVFTLIGGSIWYLRKSFKI